MSLTSIKSIYTNQMYKRTSQFQLGGSHVTVNSTKHMPCCFRGGNINRRVFQVIFSEVGVNLKEKKKEKKKAKTLEWLCI